MLRRKADPNKVDLQLFYEFAETLMQDVESLQVEIERLKCELARRLK